MAGVDLQIVPYKGTAPLMNDLVGGHIPVAFGVLPPAISNIEVGNLRALAVTSLARFSLLPNVPTVAESGLPGFEAGLHYGLLAPKARRHQWSSGSTRRCARWFRPTRSSSGSRPKAATH